ncbi:RNA methyltransferase [Methylobacillus flagellatus]|uniref:tRNA (cytidine/uridine-2'-O-)-methyltransferase TrmJ n=1 Tax=Methylobacillus flagellatus (strain ATCC 51484 / DSM 6875 / VKM B-1610 / KT) TaxID=265072 RepID=Q1H357_METFK|nr:RNA methyltransferase [Methylobacillus flagellatus]ABE49080.1 RNA methyltransferase TrmH, group 1 [Methylobacillus flagellatus KT]
MTSKLNLLQQIRIVLCQTSHPGNIGAAARAMKTMGLSQLVLVKPKSFPHAEATAMASGATDILDNTQVCATLAEALHGTTLAIGMSARRRELSHELVSARTGVQRAIEAAHDAPVAIVFGTEMSGLSNAELDHCQLLAMIPANPEYSSLNLAAAVQVISYELRMAVLDHPGPTRTESAPLATSEEIERLYAHLEQVLIEIGFLNPAQPKRLMQRLRRMYGRARLEKEEVNILRGILSATQTPRPPRPSPEA